MTDLQQAAESLMAETNALIESLRISTVKCLNVLYSEPEIEFDTIANLAADIAQCPISAITILDTGTAYCKSMVGVDESVRCTNRNESLCNVAVKTPHRALIITDALQDKRVCTLPWIAGNYDVFRFYAGFPLVFDDVAVGTLCVVDREPKILAPDRIAILEKLSQLATIMLEKRAQAKR